MYPKENRLRKKKDFEQVWQAKKSAYLKFLGMKIVENHQNNTRFGVIISNKISKKAVIRNKIKRRIRNIVTKEKDKIKKGWDVVIIGQPAIIEAGLSEIKNEIRQIFTKLKLYS